MIQIIGKPHYPLTRIDAQLHLPKSTAVALITGKAFIAEYEPPLLNDPEVKSTDGRVINVHVDHASSAPENPLSPDKIIEKFKTLAGRTLPAVKIEKFLDKVQTLPSLPDVRKITSSLLYQFAPILTNQTELQHVFRICYVAVFLNSHADILADCFCRFLTFQPLQEIYPSLF